MNTATNLNQIEVVGQLVDKTLVLKNAFIQVMETWDMISIPTTAQCDECQLACQVMENNARSILRSIELLGIEEGKELAPELKAQLDQLFQHLIELKTLLSFQTLMLTIDRMASTERCQIDFGMARPAHATVH